MEAILVIVGSRVLSAAVAVLTKKYLFAIAVIGFSLCGMGMLTASAFMSVGGWWQNVFVSVGTGLLFVGLVDLAILGALRRFIDPSDELSVTVQGGDGSTLALRGIDERTLAVAFESFYKVASEGHAEELRGLTAAIQRLESSLHPPQAT